MIQLGRSAALLALAGLLGCATIGPRFDQAVTASFAHQPMRKFETDRLELYYPAAHHDEAMRVARRLDACIAQLRTYPKSPTPRPKFLVYLTTANFNNAYVQPEVVGYPQQMVLAHHMTLEFFNWLELGESEIGDISCHEAVHYVQMQQVDGFWSVVDLITGSFLQPNVFTESWFLEGIATQYEGRLGKATGRPSSPVWNGLFQSVVEARGGQLNPGDLSPENRQLLPFGGNYVVGQQFVDYLARTYGAQKLWQLIDRQGRSIFSPFGVTLRFKSVYGKTIGGLFDDFVSYLKAHLTHRVRSAHQHVFAPDIGYFARLAVGASDGAVATVTAGLDDVVRLIIRERDGRVRVDERLTQIIPVRRWVSLGPLNVSGMSFSRDGRFLYFVDADVNELGEDDGRLFRVDASDGAVLQIWDHVRGMGGSISPDGRRYVYVEVTGDTANLVALDLASGHRESLTRFTGAMSLGAPAYSPDGLRVAFSAWSGDGFDLYVLLPDGHTQRLTTDARFNYGAQWLDDDRLLFEREVGFRSQVHVARVSTGVIAQVTDAPFIALDPFPAGPGKVAFLNRDGWGWSVDEAPILPMPPAPETARGPGLTAEAPEPPLPAGTDSPYSPWDHAFVPVLHAPFFYLQSTPAGGLAPVEGVSVSGSDRLGLQNYAANVWYEQGQNGPDFTLGYGNYQLAPWLLTASLSRIVSRPSTDWQADIGASRTFWTTPLAFSLDGFERTYALRSGSLWRVRMLGPSAAFGYAAVESTPYGGGKRGLGISLSGTYFPGPLSDSLLYGSRGQPGTDIADVRGELFGYVPLPFLARQSLRLGLVGRGVPGAPPGLLQVGGVSPALYEWIHPRPAGDGYGPGPLLLPSGLSFVEPMRGYEDFAFHANEVAIASAVWSYPIVFDYGWASTLYLFPSLFVSQLNIELFGNVARTDVPQEPWHRDVGAAVLLHLTFGQYVPVTLFYQFSRRFDDGLAPLHLFGVSLQ